MPKPKEPQEPYFIQIVNAGLIQVGYVLVTIGGDYSEKGEWLVEKTEDAGDSIACTMQHRKSGKRTVSTIKKGEIAGRKVMRSLFDTPVQQPGNVVQ